MAEKLITPEFRGSFVALAQPKKMKGAKEEDPPLYQVMAVIPKGDPFWKKAEKAIQEVAKEKWGKIPPKFKSPIKDGDTDGEYENLKGCYFFNANNERRPGIVDGRLDKIIDGEELYSGAWYRISVNVYAWEHPTGGKGASFGLNNVQKVKDDERFDGGTTAEEDFAGYVVEDEDDEESLLN